MNGFELFIITAAAWIVLMLAYIVFYPKRWMDEPHPADTPAQDYWPDNPPGYEWTDPEFLARKEGQ